MHYLWFLAGAISPVHVGDTYSTPLVYGNGLVCGYGFSFNGGNGLNYGYGNHRGNGFGGGYVTFTGDAYGYGNNYTY